jgi:hypothetical protein
MGNAGSSMEICMSKMMAILKVHDDDYDDDDVKIAYVPHCIT